MLTIDQIRAQRTKVGIPAIALAAYARMNRARLSYLEHGHVQPKNGELEGLWAALEGMMRERAAALLGAAGPAAVPEVSHVDH